MALIGSYRKSRIRLLLIVGCLAGTLASPVLCVTEDGVSSPAKGYYQPQSGTFRLLESEVSGDDPFMFIWEVADTPDLYKPYQGTDAVYKDFVAWVRTYIEPDPQVLLIKQREYQKAKGKSTKKYDLVLSGQLGRIRPMNRLEAVLFLVQIHRFGKPYEGEFCAFVLRKNGRLRIYGYGTSKQTLQPGKIQKMLKGDITNKWEYYAMLHNHPFIFSETDPSYGELIPSGDATYGDIQCYLADAENFGLQRAWITSGFHSIELMAKEFPLGDIPDSIQ